jgi:hypothetical protein
MFVFLPQCEQIQNLIQITQHFITDIEEVGVLLGCKTFHYICEEVLNTPFNELNRLLFRQVCDFDTSLLVCHRGSAVLAHIDFHEFVYVCIKTFKDVIRGYMTAVQMRLPVVELYLLPHLEKKMNRGG